MQVRVLRPLRLIQRWSGMRLVVETLIQAAPTVSNVVLFGMFQFIILAILCVQLFAGGLSVCSQVRGAAQARWAWHVHMRRMHAWMGPKMRTSPAACWLTLWCVNPQ